MPSRREGYDILEHNMPRTARMADEPSQIMKMALQHSHRAGESQKRPQRSQKFPKVLIGHSGISI